MLFRLVAPGLRVMYYEPMKALAPALACALVTRLCAQSLAPELEPLAAKYRADMAAFNAQKAVAMTRAQQPYVLALDGAEKAATSAGTVGAVILLFVIGLIRR